MPRKRHYSSLQQPEQVLVLRMRSEGKTIGAIAKQLGRAHRTVQGFLEKYDAIQSTAKAVDDLAAQTVEVVEPEDAIVTNSRRILEECLASATGSTASNELLKIAARLVIESKKAKENTKNVLLGHCLNKIQDSAYEKTLNRLSSGEKTGEKV